MYRLFCAIYLHGTLIVWFSILFHDHIQTAEVRCLVLVLTYFLLGDLWLFFFSFYASSAVSFGVCCAFCKMNVYAVKLPDSMLNMLIMESVMFLTC